MDALFAGQEVVCWERGASLAPSQSPVNAFLGDDQAGAQVVLSSLSIFRL
jgi:hypothetical protein